MKLLKAEAIERDTTVKDVLAQVLQLRIDLRVTDSAGCFGRRVIPTRSRVLGDGGSKECEADPCGRKVGGADEFLGVTKEESFLVEEMKLDLAAGLKELRASRKLSQAEVAKLLGSSQSRVAKWRPQTER